MASPFQWDLDRFRQDGLTDVQILFVVQFCDNAFADARFDTTPTVATSPKGDLRLEAKTVAEAIRLAREIYP